jgi:hypothetical protein
MTRFHSALVAAFAIAALAAFARPAAAVEYPWCAQLGAVSDGGSTCGFATFEQCMETVRGVGSFCERNLFYTAVAEPPAKKPRLRSRD